MKKKKSATQNIRIHEAETTGDVARCPQNIRIHEAETTGDQPRYTKEFAALQAEWYAKLAAETDFVDLEYVGHNRLDASAAPLKTTSSPDQGLGDRGITYHYYALLSNFLSHNKRYGTLRDRVICRLYIEGVSYRKICKHEKVQKLIKQGKFKPFSYFIVFQVVNKFEEVALAWNKTHVEGLEYKEILDAAEDSQGGGEA